MDKLSQENLNKLREKIDKLDSELLDLLSQRAELSIKIGQIKKTETTPVFCRPDRETQIINNIINHNNGPLEKQDLEKIFKLIFSISCELQKNA